MSDYRKFHRSGRPIEGTPRRRAAWNMARPKHARPSLMRFRFHRDFVLLSGIFLVLVGMLSVVAIIQLLQPSNVATVVQPEQAIIPLQPSVTPVAPDMIVSLAPPDTALVPEGMATAETAAPPDVAAMPEDTVPSRDVVTFDSHLDGITISAIDDYMHGLVEEHRFSGAVLVARGDHVLITKGYGMADWQQGIANTPQTRFRLASLTKPFTAMGILILHERGQLNMHDPICTYLPDCPEIWQPVTVRHLLTHTSGLPNYTDFIDFEETEMLATTPQQLIERFKHMELLQEPGLFYHYNNSGYVLLGVIIEQVAGQPYEEFLRSNIFEPLQMHNTGYDHNVEFIRDQAIGYARVDEVHVAPFIDTSTLHAAGALYSTVEDMYRWDRALYTDALISEQLRNEMFTPIAYGYGYGWKISTNHDRRMASHSGFLNGFSNFMARYPDEQVYIIVLSNLQTSLSETISSHLARLVFDPLAVLQEEEEQALTEGDTP